MIRFIYRLPTDLDPGQLHKDFRKMEVLESDYDYLPGERAWRLTVTEGDQAFRVETVLKIRRIPFEVRVGGGGSFN